MNNKNNSDNTAFVILSDEQKEIIAGRVCPYCKSKTQYVNSSVVYGTDYGMIYLCKPCDAYVGVHRGTSNAKGRLANKELRTLKKEAHEYFDKIWQKPLKLMSRTEAYEWLSKLLELPKEYTHIGMLGIEKTKEVIYFSKQYLNDNRRLDLDFGLPEPTPYYELT